MRRHIMPINAAHHYTLLRARADRVATPAFTVFLISLLSLFWSRSAFHSQGAGYFGWFLLASRSTNQLLFPSHTTDRLEAGVITVPYNFLAGIDYHLLSQLETPFLAFFDRINTAH